MSNSNAGQGQDQMDEQKIRQMIREEIANSNNTLRFQQTAIAKHTHNGIDSPFVFSPIVNYTGIYSTTSNSFSFPPGWNLVIVGTGQYKVVHNLKSNNYVIQVTASETAVGCIPVIDFTGDDTNQFSIDFVSPFVAAPYLINTGFMFTLTQSDNKSITPPANNTSFLS